ncbi:MAG TPA: hypothetical protein PKA37_12625, partial [Planctomycetota bacterium]|nr:hypothetical protein [Planctomycetota bacterium]
MAPSYPTIRTPASTFKGRAAKLPPMIGPNGVPGEFRTVPCPLCGSAEHIIVHRDLSDLLLRHPSTFAIRECRNCQMQ